MSRGLGRVEQDVLVALADGVIYPDADDLRTSKRALRRAINSLVDKGFITWSLYASPSGAALTDAGWTRVERIRGVRAYKARVRAALERYGYRERHPLGKVGESIGPRSFE